MIAPLISNNNTFQHFNDHNNNNNILPNTPTCSNKPNNILTTNPTLEKFEKLEKDKLLNKSLYNSTSQQKCLEKEVTVTKNHKQSTSAVANHSDDDDKQKPLPQPPFSLSCQYFSSSRHLKAPYEPQFTTYPYPNHYVPSFSPARFDYSLPSTTPASLPPYGPPFDTAAASFMGYNFTRSGYTNHQFSSPVGHLSCAYPDSFSMYQPSHFTIPFND